MSPFFEALMIICFGVSWPMSIAKSLRSKTAKGKSLMFMLFILSGYAFGIISKLTSGNITYVLPLYIANFIMVGTDILLYFRNMAYDKSAIQER